MFSSGSQVVDLINQEELPSSVQAELAIKVNGDQLAKNSVNVCQEQSESEPRITRVRTLTEKGRAYQEQRQKEHEKDEDQLVARFHEAYDAWRTQATEIESLMAKQTPSSQVEKEEAILRLREFRNKIEKIYDKIRIERAPGQEIRQKMDGCDALTQTLERKSIAASCNEDVKSVRSRSSKASTKSRRSRSSRSSRAPSLIDLKKADAAAELAAREVEFNALQEETKHKEATARMEAELAQRKLELEQMEAKKQIEIARAKLKVYQEVEEFEDDMDSVEDDYLQTSPIQINLETEAASFIPPQKPKYSVPDANTPISTAQPALQPQEKEAHPSAAQFIMHDFYVDDGLTSVESVQEAEDLIRGAREICEKGGLRLHKFVSNDCHVLESVPKSERAVDVILNLPSEQRPIERVLGVQWSVGLDCFRFSIILKDQPLTRRGVLATVASVYDPLGFLAPLVLRAKKILQGICNKGVNWDEPLPEEVRPRWDRWKRDLLHIDELEIARCFEPKTLNGKKTCELHSFADVSTSGYGQCSYLRVKDEDENVHVSLVMGKSRVAPTKITTIPRLELTAAVVSAKVAVMVQEELNYVNMKQYFWTDSKVVLGYINNDAKRFQTFVANRVQVIRSNTDIKEWRYIDTNNNPADHASRGLNAEDLMTSNWFSGPAFLWEKEIPPSEEEIPTIQIGDPEVKATVRATTVKEPFYLIDFITRCSSWTKAVGVVSYL